MSAAHAIVSRRCPACGEPKPGDEFHASYCRPCSAAYSREWHRARAQGRPVAEWRPIRLHPAASPPPYALVLASTLNDLKPQYLALFGHTLRIGGFGALHKLIEESRTEVAKANQRQIAREGWIV